MGGPIRPGYYRAVFSNRGARLLELDLGDYYRTVGLSEDERQDVSNWLPLVESVETRAGATGSLLLKTSSSSEDLAPAGLEDVLWTMRVLDDRVGVEFRYGPGTGVIFTKRITFEPGTWNVRLRLEIENRSAGPGGRREFVLVPAECVVPELASRFYVEPQAVAVGGEEISTEGAPGVDAPGPLEVPTPLLLAGVHNKYFAFLLHEDADKGTREPLRGARYRPVVELGLAEPRDLIAVDVPLRLDLPGPGQTAGWDYLVYAGPKEPVTFIDAFEPHELVVKRDLSGSLCGLDFSAIGNILLVVLRFFHRFTGNWGVAIILMTISVRLALFPLNRRSQTSMARYQKKMKRVQPQLDEVKKRYENDSKKLREAQGRIMQQEGAYPPLGGCLPIFLQLPIFFGLFSMLRTTFDLRQEPFYGWITDLSQPDRLMRLDLELPLFLPDIEYLNVLPLLMVVMWILQQKGMPQPTDEQAKRMQKMMTFMPIVFGLMLYNYAAGLSLYIMTSSTLGIFEQKVVKKVWPIDDTEVMGKKKKKKGCGPFAGVMEHMAEKQRGQLKRMQAVQAEQRRQTARKKKKRR